MTTYLRVGQRQMIKAAAVQNGKDFGALEALVRTNVQEDASPPVVNCMGNRRFGPADFKQATNGQLKQAIDAALAAL